MLQQKHEQQIETKTKRFTSASKVEEGSYHRTETYKTEREEKNKTMEASAREEPGRREANFQISPESSKGRKSDEDNHEVP